MIGFAQDKKELRAKAVNDLETKSIFNRRVTLPSIPCKDVALMLEITVINHTVCQLLKVMISLSFWNPKPVYFLLLSGQIKSKQRHTYFCS